MSALAVVMALSAPAAAQPCAYVAQPSGSVAVIDTASNTVAGTLTLGCCPSDVAVTPDESSAYVALGNRGSVDVVDVASGTVAARIPTGTGDTGRVVVAPDGNTAYAATTTAPGAQMTSSGQVVVIDTATRQVSTTVDIPTGVIDLAVSADSSSVWATNGGAAIDLDAATNTVVAAVSNIGATHVALNPDGSSAYVSGTQGIYVIDTTTRTISDVIPVTGSIDDIAVTPNGSSVYASNGDKVLVIDTATNGVSTSVPIANNALRIAFRADGATAYVTDATAPSVSVLDTANTTVTDTIAVGATPAGITVAATGGCPGAYPTPTPSCTGDCNGDSMVTVPELITMVNVVLGSAPTSACYAGDANGDGSITVNEIIAAVANALHGCSAAAGLTRGTY